MSFNFDGYKVVSIEPFRLKTPFVTIGKSVRLSRKAFEALGNPRFVILDFNQFKRTLSISKYELEEGQLRPLEPTRSSAALAVGTVDDSRYIIGISEFRRMLREQFKNDYRLRLPGEIGENGLVFQLDDAVLFISTERRHCPAIS